ncbi:hypothetical protein ACO0M4_09595 [Streptomyces sp. RGM 3693]|uniref:hypothetical protein n=1 Tax=Streptomyces sp. RGM 3693 TaxID=3413284 RepID=UPI003D2BC1A9
MPRWAPVPEHARLVRVPLRGEPVPVRRFVAVVRRGSANSPRSPARWRRCAR